MSKTISQNEINHLFEFVRQKRIRYKDVQIEMVDHLASAIEDLMEKEPPLSFRAALDKVYKGFGVYGFAKVVSEKEKYSRKFWRGRIWKYFKQFYQLPQLIGTAGASLLLYQLISIYPSLINYLIGTTAIIGFLGLVYFCFLFKIEYSNRF